MASQDQEKVLSLEIWTNKSSNLEAVPRNSRSIEPGQDEREWPNTIDASRQLQLRSVLTRVSATSATAGASYVIANYCT